MPPLSNLTNPSSPQTRKSISDQAVKLDTESLTSSTIPLVEVVDCKHPAIHQTRVGTKPLALYQRSKSSFPTKALREYWDDHLSSS